MRTVVLGGGVIGVTTAYYLAKEGHEVTLVEGHEELAQDASGGNAGLIAPGHSFAWASPAAPRMLLKSLLGEKTAIRVKLNPDPRLISWGVKFLRECTTERAIRNTLVKLQLCQYSQRAMDELAATESIDYAQELGGVLYLYRDQRELDLGVKKMALLRDHGQKQDVLDAEAIARLDPTFAPVKDRIAGAIHGLSDGSGDSEKFTKVLAERCTQIGVQFLMGTRVQALVAEGDEVTAAITDKGVLAADNFVLALGVDSPSISRTVGQRLPIYPGKGYSVTFPIRDQHTPPALGGVDERTLVAWSRLGDQLRVSSTAEFSGYGRDWEPEDFSNILHTVRELFPNAADFDKGRYRACLRPMTPDGPPILGRGKHANLFYNTGHGHMGWTMACGSSRIVTDLMLGRRPELALKGMGVRS
jgi:D-amino-acid dehydrogenase